MLLNAFERVKLEPFVKFWLLSSEVVDLLMGVRCVGFWAWLDEFNITLFILIGIWPLRLRDFGVCDGSPRLVVIKILLFIFILKLSLLLWLLLPPLLPSKQTSLKPFINSVFSKMSLNDLDSCLLYCWFFTDLLLLLLLETELIRWLCICCKFWKFENILVLLG